MSGFRPSRFPHRPRGPYPFDDPRFPPFNPPPRPNFRPHFRGRSGGFVPGPRGRFPSPYGQDRPPFSNRGKGHHGNRSHDQGCGIEAYYKHSMVEDPWKELEENFKKQNQKLNEQND